MRLKDDVPLSDGLDDLALHPQDGPSLIGFLKTMEFTSLTAPRRRGDRCRCRRRPAGAVKVEWGADAHGPDLAGADARDAVRSAEAAAGTATPARKSPAAPLPTPGSTGLGACREAVAGKFDVAAYACIRDVASLNDWIAEATQAGIVAFAAETTSPTRCGRSCWASPWPSRPGRAAYVPLAHKTGKGDLLGGGLAENQIAIRDALALMKPLLEDRSVLKLVQNVKYDLVVLTRHGIDVAPIDDTMLMSYVLDAGLPAATPWRLSPNAGSATSRSHQGHCRLAAEALGFDQSISPRPPAMRPRMPTSRSGSGRC